MEAQKGQNHFYFTSKLITSEIPNTWCWNLPCRWIDCIEQFYFEIHLSKFMWFEFWFQKSDFKVQKFTNSGKIVIFNFKSVKKKKKKKSG